MAKIITDTRKRVKAYLKQIYGKNYAPMVLEIDDAFIVRRGSAAVHVSVRPLGKDDCVVQAMAYVVQGAKIGPKLLTYLMRLNASYPVGAYGLLFDDTVTFSHGIAGAHLDANELRTTIGTVAFVADETDDEIRKIAGGMRAVDANAAIFAEAAIAAAPAAPAKKAPAAKTTAAVKKAPAAKKTAAVKKPAARKRA